MKIRDFQPWRVPRRIAYIVSHSYPYSSNGYAVRTHGIAKALVENGCSVIAINRPGRPWDLPGFEVVSVPHYVEQEGVRYLFSPEPSSRLVPFEEWCEKAEAKLMEFIKVFKPSIVMAASDWQNALPALNVARQSNLPFFYEVRGFWEITKASREPAWQKTKDYHHSVERETYIATNADRVFTLNRFMRDELVKRGVAAGKIALVPNSWGNSLPALNRQSSLENSDSVSSKYIVGYVGSFSDYEGLDNLVKACAKVRERGTEVSLLLIGSSKPTKIQSDKQKCPFSERLLKLADALGIAQHVDIIGRIEQTSLGDYYARMDVVVNPRKALPVCEIVSPIKTIEAAAYGVPILVSDVAPLRDLAGESGIRIFRKDDIDDLAEKLTELLLDKETRRRMSQQARQWIKQSRLFNQTIHPVIEAIRTYDLRYIGSSSNALLRNINDKSQLTSTLESKVETEATTTQTIADVGITGAHAFDQSKYATLHFENNQHTLSQDQTDVLNRNLVMALLKGGSKALQDYLYNLVDGHSERLKAFCEIKAANVLLSHGKLDESFIYTQSALQRDRSAGILRGAIRIYSDATKLDRALPICEELEGKLKNINSGDRKLFDEVKKRLKLIKLATKPAGNKPIKGNEKTILNILAFSLPYTSVGYATRSHGLAIGIKNAGWNISPYTRPGFPGDFKVEFKNQTLANQDTIDGITYHRIFDFDRQDITEVEYILQSVAVYERIIQSVRPSIVHAASNYVTALPALIAARQQGVPFIYEVRGFWEFTRSSRDEDFENTAKYRYMQLFESLVAKHADEVITITSAMKEELLDRGVPRNKISIAYNSVDTDRFHPIQPDRNLAEQLGIPEGVPVIGYVGSFVDYEGLDDLVSAAAGLRNGGRNFRLLLVGDGAVFDSLKEQVSVLHLQKEVILTGRVPHESVEAYYSLVDIAPFPRKPWKVCELVSPLKPFEAMALGKVAVVSSTRALTEIVQNDINGIVFEKGSVKSLQEALDKLIQQPETRQRLGKAARDWVIQHRSWDIAGGVCVSTYERIARVKAKASRIKLER